MFADFDLTGTLDLIVPICFDPECKNSYMFFMNLTDLWTAKSWTWRPMSLDLLGGQLTFYPPGVQCSFITIMKNLNYVIARKDEYFFIGIKIIFVYSR